MRTLVLLLLMLVAPGLMAQELVFALSGIKVSELVAYAYSDAFKAPYVLSPDVTADTRTVSLRIGGKPAEAKEQFNTFLRSLGYEVVQRRGVDFVEKHSHIDGEKEILVYRPKYREVTYLIELCRPLFKGAFVNQRTIPAIGNVPQDKAVPPGSAAAMVDRGIDVLIFSSERKEILALTKLLEQVDTPTGEVLARAVLYEVTTGSDSGSAFHLAANILSNRLQISLGSDTGNLGGSLRIKSGSLDAVLAALSADSHFKVVSSPSLRVHSGATARFTAGQDVPILGAVTYAGNAGQPVQSVEYKPSGVIFELTPQVRESVVDVQLLQQVSSFALTTTGVNNSPTLIKRELKTGVSVASGDVILLGGMTESKDTNTASGLPFLPSWAKSKGYSNGNTEILLVLQVTKL
jgi:general secretion pathway protein D